LSLQRSQHTSGGLEGGECLWSDYGTPVIFGYLKTWMERAVEKVNERGGEPNPDIEPSARANDFQTIALETLVRMKLNDFRRKDQVHLLDMISLGMIDASWLDRFTEQLRARLEELLNDPDG
jgi:hypothetical protein